MIRVGPVALRNAVVLAPMAGITDLPFRELAFELGAGLVVAEMTSADPRLFQSDLSRERRVHASSVRPRAVQIAGGNPEHIALAAQQAVEAGADLIDINMGCPAKKVCQQAAGSSLLRDEALVERILRAAAAAVRVPVTVKIRTGWSPLERNGVRVARIAEDAGIASIAVHGRTRACRFEGAVEYDTIAAIKAAVSIPVFANGDIDTIERARMVLAHTGADGLLIGRAALGAPWLPGDIAGALQSGGPMPSRTPEEILAILCRHLARMHDFYGDDRAARIARKHVKSYLERMAMSRIVIHAFNAIQTAAAQRAFVAQLGSDVRWAMAA